MSSWNSQKAESRWVDGGQIKMEGPAAGVFSQSGCRTIIWGPQPAPEGRGRLVSDLK